MPAPAFGWAKRITNPPDGNEMVRLRGDDHHHSSGSEHGAAGVSSFDVPGFFFSDSESSDGGDEVRTGDERPGGDDDERSGGLSGCEERQCSFYAAVPSAGMIRDLVNPRAASPAEDRFRRDVEADVAALVARFSGLRPNQVAFRRAVMGSLRGIGYNAGICRSTWESGGGGLVAGTHEYIDVLTSSTAASPQRRYIVDVEFAGEFEIARPTAEYGRLSAELPRVFVGRAEELRRLLRLLADAAKRSLREREMHLPPWRKSRYMQAKWLGPYRRTINPFFPPSLPSSSSSAAAPAPPSATSFGAGRGDVKCRFVGFDATSSPVIVQAARTR